MSKVIKATPKESQLLQTLFKTYEALKGLGWTEPRYLSVRDGEEFDSVELGSTGIHNTVRQGNYTYADYEWPTSSLLVRRRKK